MNRHTEWTDRFSAYLAGELLEADRAAVEAHLAECGSCRGVLEELQGVVEQAGALAETAPERDLWPGIAAVISAPKGVEVIELPTAGSASEPNSFPFTVPQLAAASIALLAVSFGMTMWTGPGIGVQPEMVATAPVEDPVAFASVEAEPPAELADELRELELTLDAARDVLDPNTIRILERNLAVIEQAIVDSRQALAIDPGNDFLNQHLERVYERKLDYLREAARVVEWAG